ncbi:MAG: putative HSP20-like chaperone (modular protein) [Gammaproteobacteria bacterium]|jgi:HSP20 family protein|nr:putative HSP20-like chaperone (modular protein) [Gammaproteobacteria bacterium]
MSNLVNLEQFLPIFSKHSDNPIFSLHQEIDKVFNQFYKEFLPDNFSKKNTQDLSIRPVFDIVEDDKIYKIEMEMPGLSEKDISVSIKEGELYIHAKKEISQKDEGKEYVRREISYGNYESYIDLPTYVDTNEAKASFKKGMLWISFPKKNGADHSLKKLTIEKVE